MVRVLSLLAVCALGACATTPAAPDPLETALLTQCQAGSAAACQQAAALRNAQTAQRAAAYSTLVNSQPPPLNPNDFMRAPVQPVMQPLPQPVLSNNFCRDALGRPSPCF